MEIVLDAVIPAKLKNWLLHHGARENDITSQQTPVVDMKKPLRRYVLASVSLKNLIDSEAFKSTEYNPREADPTKVINLQASIRNMSMLSPLTCAFLDSGERKEVVDPESVVLIDGRHRYEALKKLADEEANKKWLAQVRIDLKIFYDLQSSDLHVLATYLNRTRQPLKKGEYYSAIVKIFDEKFSELVQSNKGISPTEREVFESIVARQLQSRNFDLSVGRIVGITAFNKEEQGTWYPYVGFHQADRIDAERHSFYGYYCPLTAGNMALFLKPICKTEPYDEDDDLRSVEIGNTFKVGQYFTECIFRNPVMNRGKFTDTTVGCKSWCISALGDLLADSKSVSIRPSKMSLLSRSDIDWNAMKDLLKDYMKLMGPQAQIIQEYSETPEGTDRKMQLYKEAWTLMTEKKMIYDVLKKKFSALGHEFRERKWTD